MTRDEAVAIIASRLGNRGSTFDTQIVTEMQGKQTELEGQAELPWFLTYQDTAQVTVAATNYIATPTGFLMEDGDAEQFVIGTDGGYNPIRKMPYGMSRGSSLFNPAVVDPGLPEQYALQGARLYFFPTPDAVYSLELNYFKADTTLTTNVTNQWLTYAHDVLVAETGLQMARFLRDESAVQMFTQDLQRAYKRLWTNNEARRQANLDAVLGG